MGHFIEDNSLNIVVEFVQHGTYRHQRYEKGHAFDLADKLHIAQDISRGLFALHRREIIHHHISNMNVMVRILILHKNSFHTFREIFLHFLIFLEFCLFKFPFSSSSCYKTQFLFFIL